MSLSNEVVISMVKVGDIVNIEPIDKVPNIERSIKVDAILDITKSKSR